MKERRFFAVPELRIIRLADIDILTSSSPSTSPDENEGEWDVVGD